MARARNIKPAIFKNEILGTLDPLITILFQSLWCLADRDGKLEDRPLRIKAETFPYRDNLDINGYLTELQRHGFIVRYIVNGIAIIKVVKFHEHQSPHNTEKQSVLPDNDFQVTGNIEKIELTVKQPLKDEKITEDERPDSLNLIHDSLIPDSLNVKQRAKALKPSKKCPDDFVITQEMRDWVISENLSIDIDLETKVFKDHTFKNACTDWFATWRNWIRRANGYSPKVQLNNRQTALEARNRQAVQDAMRGSI